MAHDSLPTPFTGGRLAAGGPFGTLQAQMTRLMEEMLRGGGTAAGDAGLFLAAPRVDVTEDAGSVQVTAEMPGLSEQDIEVGFEDGHLHISGEKVKESGEGRRDVVAERAYGRFDRQVFVGRNIDRDGIEARFENGVLTVTLPKTEAGAGTRRIEVKRGA